MYFICRLTLAFYFQGLHLQFKNHKSGVHLWRLPCWTKRVRVIHTSATDLIFSNDENQMEKTPMTFRQGYRGANSQSLFLITDRNASQIEMHHSASPWENMDMQQTDVWMASLSFTGIYINYHSTINKDKWQLFHFACIQITYSSSKLCKQVPSVIMCAFVFLWKAYKIFSVKILKRY